MYCPDHVTVANCRVSDSAQCKFAKTCARFSTTRTYSSCLINCARKRALGMSCNKKLPDCPFPNMWRNWHSVTHVGRDTSVPMSGVYPIKMQSSLVSRNPPLKEDQNPLLCAQRVAVSVGATLTPWSAKRTELPQSTMTGTLNGFVPPAVHLAYALNTH